MVCVPSELLSCCLGSSRCEGWDWALWLLQRLHLAFMY